MQEVFKKIHTTDRSCRSSSPIINNAGGRLGLVCPCRLCGHVDGRPVYHLCGHHMVGKVDNLAFGDCRKCQA